MIASWVALCAKREHPLSLAIVRIAIALVLLSDLLTIFRLDLIIPLFVTDEYGGLSDIVSRGKAPWFLQVFGASEGSGVALYWVMVVACLAVLVGVMTRTACMVLLLAWAQHALILSGADRGIDMLMRNLLFLLMFSGCGQCLSVDSWLRDRTWLRRDLECMAWPRYLILLQVVVMYSAAGIEKMGFAWTPLGGYSALYLILQDWAILRTDMSWLGTQPFYFLSQLGTAGTLFWEWSAPLLLLAVYYRATPERGGRMRGWMNRVWFRSIWLTIGCLFHVLLVLTMELGIFPFAMLATYLAFYGPEEWFAFRGYLRGKWTAVTA
jgi:hypothetical protein